MMDTNDRMPDLPGLEQVEARIEGGSLCLPGCAVLVVIAILWWIIPQCRLALLAVGAGVTGIAYLVAYMETGVARTGRVSVAVERPLRGHIIPWPEVTEVRQKAGWAVLDVCDCSRTKRASVPNDPLLLASMWQHLRRQGKADALVLSDDALSVWAAIPDEIPDEMDYFDDIPEHVAPQARYQLRRDSISEEVTSVTKEALEYVKGRPNPLVIPWDDVVAAQYGQANQDYDFLYLTIRASDGAEMHIRDYDDLESARFLLAVIRRARQAPSAPAVVIPKGLRDVCGVRLPRR